MAGRSFEPHSAPVYELYVVLLTGIKAETSSAKSRYTSVLRIAQNEDAPADPELFADWLKNKGGISKLIELHKEKKEEDGGSGSIVSKPQQFSLPGYVEYVATKGRTLGPVSIPIGEEEQCQGLCVVLLHAGSKGNDTPDLVGKSGDEKLVRAVAAAFAKIENKGRTGQEIDAHERRMALWTVNRVALAIAGKLKEKVTDKGRQAFYRAVAKLHWLDHKTKTLFDELGRSRPWTSDRPDLNDDHELWVVNPEFDLLDPGRFILHARPGAMIGYDTSGDVDQAITAYVREHLQIWAYMVEPGEDAEASEARPFEEAVAVEFDVVTDDEEPGAEAPQGQLSDA